MADQTTRNTETNLNQQHTGTQPGQPQHQAGHDQPRRTVEPAKSGRDAEMPGGGDRAATMGEMARNAGEQARAMAAGAQDMARRAADQASAAGEVLYDQGTRAGEYLTRNVNEYPIAALLIAGAVGYGLGYLIHSSWPADGARSGNRADRDPGRRSR